MADFLLIDNSNSFTKFALATPERLSATVRRLPTRALTQAAVRRLLKDWRFQSVTLCSVVPKAAECLQKAFASLPFLQLTHKAPLGVGIDYPQPTRIGADRLANAAAAASLFPSPAPIIVVDFGTAVSFDILSSEKVYLGGVIAPGLESMTDYLHQRTALLPKITLLEPPGPIGKSTKHAMLAGAVYGYRGLVRQILSEITQALPDSTPPTVVATGGYADLIASRLPEIHQVHPSLTLEGIRLVATRHFSSLLPPTRSRSRTRLTQAPQ